MSGITSIGRCESSMCLACYNNWCSVSHRVKNAAQSLSCAWCIYFNSRKNANEMISALSMASYCCGYFAWETMHHISQDITHCVIENTKVSCYCMCTTKQPSTLFIDCSRIATASSLTSESTCLIPQLILTLKRPVISNRAILMEASRK